MGAIADAGIDLSLALPFHQEMAVTWLRRAWDAAPQRLSAGSSSPQRAGQSWLK
jgi:hypothetical protein